MKLRLPPRRRRTPWGALIWALPMAYVAWDPLQRGAHWIEWVWTALALAIFMALYVIGVMYWYDRKIVALVCAGTTLLAIAFLAYRFSGAFFFTFVAAFVPLAVGGRVVRSMAAIITVLALFWSEWWALNALDLMQVSYRIPLIISIEGLIIGAGTAFAVRLEQWNQHDLRVAERERIARDLHDVLGHTLSSIALKAELAGRLFDIDPARALAEIGDVERVSRDALQEVRAAIHGYHAGDIRAEFERAQSILKAAGVAVEQRYDEVELDPARERVLALVAREAVTNVVRHAQAKACRMALYRAGDAYRLEISDDGRGGLLTEGIGMTSIRSRIEAIGGKAAWTSGSGTQLAVTVPIAAIAEH